MGYLCRQYLQPIWLVIIWVLSSSGLCGQDVLPYGEYIQLVRSNHPVVRQASLLMEQAHAITLQAKGGFDPVVDVRYDDKYYSDKEYYQLLKSAIKVPLRFGPDVEIGFGNNSGDYLNNSDFLPPNGLWQPGISIPLGRGLLVDSRRTMLKQAALLEDVTPQQQKIIVNDVLYQASLAYLEWQKAMAQMAIVSEGLDITRQRMEGTVQSYTQGDKPAIDTLETYIALQTRIEDSIAIQLDLVKAHNNCELYLWNEDLQPIFIKEEVGPEPISYQFLQAQCDSLTILEDRLITNHPEIALSMYKVRSLEVDQRLNKENLKPDVRLTYNPLITPSQDQTFSAFDIRERKLSAGFYMPLLLRKERGKIKETAVKIDMANNDIVQKNMSIKTKTLNYRMGWSLYNDQLVVNNNNIVNYRSMLDAENIRFATGESSVFLVNTREQKYLESLQKNVSLQAKLIKERIAYIHALAGF